MSALAKKNGAGAAAVETAVVRGDLKGLNEEERLSYYNEVCRSLGINPLTQPFGYIEFQGKLRLYALRACTDQLRKLHGVSVASLRDEERDGVLCVTAHVRDALGRTDEDVGCVVVAGLKGDALANARMKAVTKAKRRATLSICGLGWLDETELDTVPEARPVQAEVKERPSPVEALPDKTKLPPKQLKPDTRPQKLMTDAIDREREMVGAGLIGPGELVAALDEFAEVEGFHADYRQWTPENVVDARKFLSQWVKGKEEAHAAAAK